jgi:hypothetical protein
LLGTPPDNQHQHSGQNADSGAAKDIERIVYTDGDARVAHEDSKSDKVPSPARKESAKECSLPERIGRMRRRKGEALGAVNQKMYICQNVARSDPLNDRLEQLRRNLI